MLVGDAIMIHSYVVPNLTVGVLRWNGTSWEFFGAAADQHASNHIDSTDEIDGDKLDIDFNPSNYTPDSTIPEASDVDDLSAHLKGVDTALGDLAGGGPHAGTHIGAQDEIDGDKLDIDFEPTNYTPNASIAEADDVDDLSAHLKGIDIAISTGGGTHGDTHTNGTDNVDGDQLVISWDPSNYTPSTVPAEADDVDDLTAHLYGVDQKLGTIVTIHSGLSGIGETDHHDNSNDPSSGEKAALAGTSGSPGAGNKFVTDADSRNSNSRTPLAHAASHLTTDEIDGDKLDIDFTPTNYIPDATPAEADDVDDLAAHLKGIDTAISTGGGTHGETHTNGTDDIDGDKLDIDFTPTNYTPDASPPEASDVDDLSAHLKGLDTALAQLDSLNSYIQTLENNLTLLMWDFYATDALFADMSVDDFEDETGINQSASTYSYDAAGDFCKPPPGVTGANTDSDHSTDSDLDQHDLFDGDTVYWQATGGSNTLGYFSSDSAGTTRLTIKQGGSGYPNVEEGIRITYTSGEIVIVGVKNDGDQDDEVCLESALSDATAVTGAFGTDVDTGDLAVSQSTAETNVYSKTLDTEASGLADYSFRNFVTTTLTKRGGNQVRVKFEAPPSYSCIVDNASIGIRDGATANTKATPVELTFSSSSGFNLSPGQSIWSDWINFSFVSDDDLMVITDLNISNGGMKYALQTNAGAYYKASSNSYNLATVSEYTYSDNGVRVYCEIESRYVTPAGQYVSHTNSSSQLDTSIWSAITDMAVTSTMSGSSTAYFALSKNKGDADEGWDVYLSSTWRQIVRLAAGVWQYKDGSDVWQSASSNTRFSALTSAFGISQNQMNETALEAIESNFSSWFSAGTLDFAYALQADGDDLPSIDKVTVTYNTVAQNMTLVLNSWEASKVNPLEAYCLLRIKPNETIALNTDLKAWISMDNGSNYEQIDGLSILKESGNFDYIRGDLPGLTGQDDATMVLKITTHNLKDIELHATSHGVKY